MDIIEIGEMIETDIKRLPMGKRKAFDRAYNRVQRAAKKHGDFGLGALLLSAARMCKVFVQAMEKDDGK